MADQWFRFYSEALNDPKVQSLDGDTFKVWVNLLCVTSQCDGHIIFDDISFHLRMSDAEALAYCQKLADKGLLVPTDHGYTPNGWNKRQYKSDSSTDRMKKYREKRKAAGLPTVGDYSKFKSELQKRDGNSCVYCGNNDKKLCVDHMLPISLGGTDDIDNLALACKECNSGKAGKSIEKSSYKLNCASAKVAYDRYMAVTVTVTPPDTEQKQNRTEQKEARTAQAVDESFSPPDWIDPALWRGWLAIRKKKSNTTHALELAVKELARLRSDEGYQPNAVLEHCIRGGYQGVYPPNKKPEQKVNFRPRSEPVKQNVRVL